MWTADLTEPARGRNDLALADPNPGYAVVDHLGAFAPDAHYMFVEAHDQGGVNILPTVNDFHGRDLREGVILADGKPHALARWLGSDGPKCH